MKKIIILIIICFLCGCSNKYLSNDELKEILKEDNYILVDVRTNEEYNELHVKESINIPYDEINKNSKIDKDKIILVYCASGKRSSIAYNILKDLDYNVYDLGSINNISLEKVSDES